VVGLCMHNSRLYRRIPQARDMRRVQSTRHDSMQRGQGALCMCRLSPTQPRGSNPSHFRACLSDCCGCSNGVGTHWIGSLFVLLCLVGECHYIYTQ
jgi:hypothetical protein